MAKKVVADEDGVRIACLDEMSYRQQLWHHTPLRDFWRVGRGYAQKLEKYGIKTMGDIARYSIHSEDLLFRLFGVNAELLIIMPGVMNRVRWQISRHTSHLPGA